MVLFEPNLNVTINKTLADKNGRYILAETSIDETNIVFPKSFPFPKGSVQLWLPEGWSEKIISIAFWSNKRSKAINVYSTKLFTIFCAPTAYYLKLRKKTLHAALFVQQIIPSYIFSLSARKPLCSGRSFWIGSRTWRTQNYRFQ